MTDAAATPTLPPKRTQQITQKTCLAHMAASSFFVVFSALTTPNSTGFFALVMGALGVAHFMLFWVWAARLRRVRQKGPFTIPVLAAAQAESSMTDWRAHVFCVAVFAIAVLLLAVFTAVTVACVLSVPSMPLSFMALLVVITATGWTLLGHLGRRLLRGIQAPATVPVAMPVVSAKPEAVAQTALADEAAPVLVAVPVPVGPRHWWTQTALRSEVQATAETQVQRMGSR